MGVRIEITYPNPAAFADPAAQAWIAQANLIVQAQLRNFLSDLAAFGVAYTVFTALPTQRGEAVDGQASAALVIEAISFPTAGAREVAPSGRNSVEGSRERMAGDAGQPVPSAIHPQPVTVDQPTQSTRSVPRPDPATDFGYKTASPPEGE